jgi:phosphoribosylanthranilate isomerase
MSPETDFPRIKICGLRRVADAELAIALGARYLGVILTARSKRTASLEEARAIVAASRQTAAEVVIVATDEPPEVLAGWLRETGAPYLQVHGSTSRLEGLANVIPAIGVATQADAAALEALPPGHPWVLADARVGAQSGGTGHLFDHALVHRAIRARRVMLAGGLNPANIAAVDAGLRAAGAIPFAYDASSGIESAPGAKDPGALRAFFAALRG